MKEFNWKAVDLNLLVAFQAMFSARSVSLAAEKCYVSQSAMSHTLQRMRTLFDDPLFERVGTKMEPTVRACEISPVIDQLLISIQNELLIKPNFEPERYEGICKIGLTDYAEQLFAPALFDAIKEQAPNSQISFFNVNRSNYQELVDKEQIDIVIGSIAASNQRFVSELLYTEQHLCLFDPSTTLFTTPLTVDELVSVEHALVSPDGRLETQVDKALAIYGCRRRVAVASRHFLTIRRLLTGRELVCIVPKRFAEMEMYTHDLKAIPAPVEIADFDINMLYLKSAQHDHKSTWLRGILANVII